MVTVTNTSPYPIAAPLTLTVGKLDVAGVAVAYPGTVHPTLDVDIDVALPRGILPPGAQVAVPVRFTNLRRLPFTFAATAAGTLLAPENSTPLTVTAYRYSGNEADPRGAPAGPGVAIVVDGVVRALTDAGSQATVLVPLHQQLVAARLAPTGAGMAHLALAAGDDWVADSTLRWLERNAGLLGPVGDFSGEHGGDLGHASHGSGIDRLANAGALSIGYILGGPDSAGIAGTDWGYRLLTTGRVTVGGKAINLGTGTWDNARYYPQVNHHHHVHVMLAPDRVP
jgi:hypothetical protein